MESKRVILPFSLFYVNLIHSIDSKFIDYMHSIYQIYGFGNNGNQIFLMIGENRMFRGTFDQNERVINNILTWSAYWSHGNCIWSRTFRLESQNILSIRTVSLLWIFLMVRRIRGSSLPWKTEKVVSQPISRLFWWLIDYFDSPAAISRGKVIKSLKSISRALSFLSIQ